MSKGCAIDAEFLKQEGYLFPRQLANGEWAALHPFIFTTGLCVGLDHAGYRTRFCYEHMGDALGALLTWEGAGDPPGPWIKEKGQVERNNPATFKDIPITEERA